MALFRRQLTAYFPADELPFERQKGNEPAGAVFLREVVDLCDSVNHCLRSFSRKKDGTLTKNSADSYARLANSTFALLMSHFETFQRNLFSDLIEWRFVFESPDEVNLARLLEKQGCNVELSRVLVGGNIFGEADAGDIIADSMPGWHDPQKVNAYFRVLFPDHTLYSNDICKELRLLWQLRHSIVHCGGALTVGDSVKIRALRPYRGRLIQLNSEAFFPALGRRFHIMVQAVLEPLMSVVDRKLIRDDPGGMEDRAETIRMIAGYESPRGSWFKEHGT